MREILSQPWYALRPAVEASEASEASPAMTPQRAYSRIATDLRLRCGLAVLADALAEGAHASPSPPGGGEAPVYSVVVDQGPGEGYCIECEHVTCEPCSRKRKTVVYCGFRGRWECEANDGIHGYAQTCIQCARKGIPEVRNFQPGRCLFCQAATLCTYAAMPRVLAGCHSQAYHYQQLWTPPGRRSIAIF